MKPQFLALLLIATVAIIALWLGSQNHVQHSAKHIFSDDVTEAIDDTTHDAAPTAISINDYTIKSFSLTQYNDNGMPRHSISAQTAAINHQTTQLSQPILITQTNDGKWQISARRAFSQDNFQSLQLSEQVRIEKTPHKVETPQDEQLIATEELNYLATRKQIFSDRQITYHNGQMILNGIGLKASLVDEEFYILKNVTGIRHDQ